RRPLPQHIQFRLQQVARHGDIMMDRVGRWARVGGETAVSHQLKLLRGVRGVTAVPPHLSSGQ
ncbi:MAG: hypothetical protein GY943_31620, partial [Chloroflexi bacterium]|nr:hypothetical protein [Chloroflexota bacterium]